MVLFCIVYSRLYLRFRRDQVGAKEGNPPSSEICSDCGEFLTFAHACTCTWIVRGWVSACALLILPGTRPATQYIYFALPQSHCSFLYTVYPMQYLVHCMLSGYRLCCFFIVFETFASIRLVSQHVAPLSSSSSPISHQQQLHNT